MSNKSTIGHCRECSGLEFPLITLYQLPLYQHGTNADLSQPLHLNMVINVGAIEEGGEEGHPGGQEAYRTEQGCQGKACG